jgi:hypothetical protein
MPDTITADRLKKLVTMIGEELRWLELMNDTDRMVLDEGSKTYGRAYRIYRCRKDSGAYSDSPLHLGDGYLGMTKREAYLSLVAILRTLEAVRAGKGA